MVRHPKALPAHATVGAVRTVFESQHVHMVLVVDDGQLVTAIEREDFHPEMADDLPARSVGHLRGRTTSPDAPLETVTKGLKESSRRRVAVVDAEGVLLGLLCLKRSGTGFCADRDVRARAAERGESE